VDVWRIKLDLEPVTVKCLESTLSADEAQRAARFHFEKDRIHYTVAHSSLRDILSRYLNCGLGELDFDTNEYGKPSVRGYKLEFNLSHSGAFALIVVGWERKVGADMERIRSDIEFESLAKRFFSPNEGDELMSLAPEYRKTAFFNCWTRKEAYIKAQGLGLSLPLDSFDVSLIPNEPALIRATRPNPGEAALWTLVSLDIAPDYAGAVAVEGQKVECRLWDWNTTIP
jgi:4'-phosphopantetheinyl transferase